MSLDSFIQDDGSEERLFASFERLDEFANIQQQLLQRPIEEEPDTEHDRQEVEFLAKLKFMVRR
jgi:hypothetical protein